MLALWLAIPIHGYGRSGPKWKNHPNRSISKNSREYPYYPRIITVAGDQGESYFKDKTPQWMGHSMPLGREQTGGKNLEVRDELSRLPT